MATGSVELERPAERLRLRIQLRVRSAIDMADAVKQLKARRTEVEEKLNTLGAEKQSIHFGNPRVDEGQKGFPTGIHFAPAAAFPGGGVDLVEALPPGSRVVAGKQERPPIKLAMDLTADWMLKSKDPLELLVEATKLQDAIKDADLSGFEEDEDLAEDTEEEEEFAFGPGGIQINRKPGDPQFQYVAVISDADYKQALRDAFQKAKAKAEDLASIANIPLGGINGLHSSRQSVRQEMTQDNGDFDEEMYYSPVAGDEDYVYPAGMHGKDSLEAFGVSPGKLKYRVAVTVTYSLKSPSK
jgi:uncharacterized protein YggE